MRESRRNKREQQAGYTLLMVVFMIATMILLTTVATQNVITQGRREREQETVWRGEQYRRAIGLYYRKFGKYPTKIDDLVKQTNGVRFLRQAYTDPMNKEDGSWRFIYVGPNGQLIGSLRQTSLLQSVLSTATMPGASPFGPSAQPAAPGPGGMNAPGAPGTGPSATQPGQTTGGGLAPNPIDSQPQPLQAAVIGGNIIGIGSKVKESSMRVYQGGDTYEKWEFIWNPVQQVAIPGQGPVNPNAPVAPGLPGAAGVQTTPGTPGMPNAPPATQPGGTDQPQPQGPGGQ